MVFTVCTFMFSTSQSHATCPAGYSSATATYFYGAGDCRIDVYYCYKTTPLGVIDIVVDYFVVDMPCGLDINYNATFFTEMSNQITNHYLGTQQLSLPPCPLTGTLLQVAFAQCIKFKNDYVNQQMRVLNCNDLGKCIRSYRVCYNAINNSVTKTYIGVTSEGTHDCSTTLPTMPPAGKTIYEEWETECYHPGCD